MTAGALRVGLSGCGGIAPWTLAQLALNPEDLAVVAVHDPDPQRREAIGAAAGVEARHAEFEALLAEPLGMVLIAGPNDVHRRQVELACARGLPCLVQKPLAPTVADGAAACAAAERAGVALGVVMMERSDPLHHDVRALLRAGFAGEITLVEGVFAHDDFVRTPPGPGSWRRDPERIGGGAFTQLAAHVVDLAEWLTGLAVTDVAALGAAGHSGLAEDTTSAAVRFDSGAGGTLAASWSARARRLAVHGTAGSVVLDPDRVVLQGSVPSDLPELPYRDVGRTVALDRAGLARQNGPRRAGLEVHAQFARFVRGVGDNPCRGRDGLRTVSVLEAVRLAASRGATVRVDATAAE